MSHGLGKSVYQGRLMLNRRGLCVPPGVREKRFYSLMIEVRPAEADAETLRLFSDVGSPALTAT
ncbi:MAG TPA: hypothetical protein VH724_06880, partial [Candidatus Angelobacter sp.]|nr:hypothetical protein [Candidatus Angelobacter sp.]